MQPAGLAPHLHELLVSVQGWIDSGASAEGSSAGELARHDRELFLRQNREVVAALYAQQRLVMLQESEQRNGASLFGDGPASNGVHLTCSLWPVGLNESCATSEEFNLSVPLQQGLLCDVLDTLTLTTNTAPMDSSDPLHYAAGHATASYRRAVELGSLPTHIPALTFRVS